METPNEQTNKSFDLLRQNYKLVIYSNGIRKRIMILCHKYDTSYKYHRAMYQFYAW